MKTWVSYIFFINGSVVLGYLGKKVYKKINGSWSYHEFNGPVLVIRNEKKQRYFLTSKIL